MAAEALFTYQDLGAKIGAASQLPLGVECARIQKSGRAEPDSSRTIYLANDYIRLHSWSHLFNRLDVGRLLCRANGYIRAAHQAVREGNFIPRGCHLLPYSVLEVAAGKLN